MGHPMHDNLGFVLVAFYDGKRVEDQVEATGVWWTV
jgi:hypothetical protein